MLEYYAHNLKENLPKWNTLEKWETQKKMGGLQLFLLWRYLYELNKFSRDKNGIGLKWKIP